MATSTIRPWEILEDAPELDAALASWTTDHELDRFVKRERDLDGWILLGLDLGRPFDLDRVIEHIS